MAALLEVTRARLYAHTEQIWRALREKNQQQQQDQAVSDEAVLTDIKLKEETAADRSFTNNFLGLRWWSPSRVKVHKQYGLACKTHREVDAESGICGECGWNYFALDKTEDCQTYVAGLNRAVQSTEETNLDEFAADQTGDEPSFKVPSEAGWDLIDPEEGLSLGSMKSTASLWFEDDDMQELSCGEEIEVNNDALSEFRGFEERENSWYTAPSDICSNTETDFLSWSVPPSDLDDESLETVNQKDVSHPMRAPFDTPIPDFSNGGFARPGFNQPLQEVRLDHTRLPKKASSLPDLRSLDEIESYGIPSLQRHEVHETLIFKSPHEDNIPNLRRGAEMVAEPQRMIVKDCGNTSSAPDWPGFQCPVLYSRAICSHVTDANGKVSVNKTRRPSFDSLYDVSDDGKNPGPSFREPSINVHTPVVATEGHWPSQSPQLQLFVRAYEGVQRTSPMEPNPSQKSPLRSEADSAGPGGFTHRTHPIPTMRRYGKVHLSLTNEIEGPRRR